MTRITMAAPLALLAMLGGCGESTAPTNTIAAGDSAAADNTADAAVADTSWTGLRDLIGQYPRAVNLCGERDRKSVAEGKRVSVRVHLVVRRIMNKKQEDMRYGTANHKN